MFPTVSALGFVPDAPHYFRALNNTGASITRGGVASLNLRRSTGSPNGATAAPTDSEPGSVNSVFYQLIDITSQDVNAGMLAGKDDVGPYNPAAGITNQSVDWVTANGIVTMSVRNATTAAITSGLPLVCAAGTNSLIASGTAPTANSKVYGFMLENNAATIGTAVRSRIFFSGIYGLGVIAG